jgi:hypothetical protein
MSLRILTSKKAPRSSDGHFENRITNANTPTEMEGEPWKMGNSKMNIKINICCTEKYFEVQNGFFGLKFVNY